MDAEGACVVPRDRCTSKLAVVMVVQNMVVIACLLVTYVYWDAKVKQEPVTVSDPSVHILFDTITDIPGGQELKFGPIQRSSMMNLTDNTRSKIFITCTGPYVVYMDICYRNIGASSGTLELKVEGRETPLSTFELHTLKEDCRGLHSTVYLKKKDKAFLYLNSTEAFKIKNITMGLHYMLQYVNC